MYRNAGQNSDYIKSLIAKPAIAEVVEKFRVEQSNAPRRHSVWTCAVAEFLKSQFQSIEW